MSKSQHYTTSDGMPFYTENHAFNHAKTLKDRTIIAPGEDLPEVNNIEVIGIEMVNTIADEIEDKEVIIDTSDASKIGEAITGQLFGLDAKTDGSDNILVENGIPEVLTGQIPELSIEDTKEAIDLGGQPILPIVIPAVEAKKENKPNNRK